MKIVFITEAGFDVGFGHLMRCLALAQGFIDENHEVFFYISSSQQEINFLEEVQHNFLNKRDFSSIEDLIKEYQIAVVDSYSITESNLKRIYEVCDNVVIFDDFARMKYPGGYIVNGLLGAKSLNYSNSNRGTVFLLGAEYQVLRREFWNVPRYEVNEQITNILITFGGSDVSNQTPKYLKKAAQIYPEAIINIVIGNGFSNHEEIYSESKLLNKVIFHHNLNDRNMMVLMHSTDLAFSACGQTLYELARVGVPSFGVVVAPNQELNFYNWRETGFLINDEISQGSLSYERRLVSSRIGKELIDGKGVSRIVDLLTRRNYQEYH